VGASQVWILVAVAVLAAVSVLMFAVWGGERRKRPTRLVGLAWGCVVAGIVFSDEGPFAYALIGAGIALAALDAALRWRT